ncbi:MAG: efflux RND transporter permease subunit [Leptospirillia bacterium]
MPDKKKSISLTDLALSHPLLTLLLLWGVITIGILSYLRMGVDLFPRVRFPLVSVTVIDPGDSPGEMTRDIVRPLEDKISALSGILHVHSSVVPGAAILTAVFKDSELDLDTRSLVKAAVEEVRARFPASVLSIRVKRENPTRQPLLWILFPETSSGGSSGGGGTEDSTLRRFVSNTVVPGLSRMKGVEKVELLLPPPLEMHLTLTPQSLKAEGGSLTSLADWLRDRSREYPAGAVTSDGHEMALSVRGEPLKESDLAHLQVPLPSGKAVLLSSLGALSKSSRTKGILFRFDGHPAVALKVFAQSGANLVTLSSRIRARLARFSPPPGGASPASRFTVLMDRSVEIGKNNRELLETLALGGCLAVLSILFFLGNVRETVVAAVAIPASILAVFPVLHFLGFTLNTLTMLALSLVVGILIDDAIVVVESINRHRAMGEDLTESARGGVGEIARAVVATTFSIVAVFAPMAMMHGVLGEFFREFGWTVSLAVVASLIVSLTVTPVLAGRGAVPVMEPPSRLFPAIGRLGVVLGDWYERGLLVAMERPAFLTLFSLVLLGSSLLLATHLPSNLIPEEDRGVFLVHVRLKGSPSLEKTDLRLDALANTLRKLPSVRSVLSQAGGSQGALSSEGFLYVSLVDSSRRTAPDTLVMDQTRKILATFSDITGTVSRPGPLGGTGETPAFQCFLLGPDPSRLDKLGRDLEAFLASQAGIRDARSSSGGEAERVILHPTPEAMSRFGLTPGRLAEWLSGLSTGKPAGKIETSSGEILFRVGLAPSALDSVERLGELPFFVAPGRSLPLSSLATIGVESSGERQNRDDQSPSVTVSAEILPPLSLGEIMDKVNGWARTALPPSYHLRYAGNADVLRDAKGQILVAILVSIGGVFLILSLLFGSMLLPLVIMVSIPFGIIGSVVALWISGISVNMMGAIGLIILFGLVTKNAILLVDCANRHRRLGKSPKQAAIISARTRLRPISMTTFAMVFGMMPMAAGLGAGGRIRESMALVVIGGLLSSMVFTLFLVPVVYSRVEGLSARWTPGNSSRLHREEETHGT